MIKKNNKYLILVNKDNHIKNEDLYEIVPYKSLYNNVYVEKETLNNFLKLKKNLEKKGYIIDIESAYRSIEYQQKVLEEIIKEKGINYAKKYVARPYYSEHHTGLAIDITLYENNKFYIDKELINHKSIEIIQNIAYKYGFIIRYPQNKEKITGYNYEPWHLRYIKDHKIAKYIYKNNLTLEEYLKRDI